MTHPHAHVRESTIEQRLLRECRKHHMLCLKFVSPSRGGVPDRIVVTPRATVFIELKRPGETPDLRQREIHQKIRRFGGEVYVLDSVTAVDQFIVDELGRMSAHRGHQTSGRKEQP